MLLKEKMIPTAEFELASPFAGKPTTFQHSLVSCVHSFVFVYEVMVLKIQIEILSII